VFSVPGEYYRYTGWGIWQFRWWLPNDCFVVSSGECLAALNVREDCIRNSSEGSSGESNRDRNCFGSSVHDTEQVGETPRCWEGSYQVHVDVAEPAHGYRYVLWQYLYVLMDLGGRPSPRRWHHWRVPSIRTWRR